jgi:hypothetical protein
MTQMIPQVCWSLINQFVGPSDDLKNYFLKNVVPKLKGKKVAKLTFRSKITGKITYGPCIMCYRQGDGKTVGCNLHPILFKDNILIVTDHGLKISLLFYFRRNVLKEFRQNWKLVGTRYNKKLLCIACYTRGNGRTIGCGHELCDGSMSILISKKMFFIIKIKYYFTLILIPELKKRLKQHVII